MNSIEQDHKYEFLVEGTDDIIFHINKNYEFTFVNNSIIKHLNINPQELVGKNLFYILYNQQSDFSAIKDRISEKLKSASIDDKPLQLRLILKQRNVPNISPYEMSVRIEKFYFGDKFGFLGKAFRPVEDPLLKFFIEESSSLSIDNNILIVKDVVDRITRNLIKYIEEDSLVLLKIALGELLFNAIEHGNLGISFQEKTELINNEKYFEFISDKKELPENKDKKVYISYTITKKSVRYFIEDAGSGFDHETFLREKITENPELCLSHGRGISMALKIFSRVIFNKKGNVVVAIKNY